MSVDYGTGPDPVAGASRATAPTEVTRWTNLNDTLADADTRLDALEAASDTKLTGYKPATGDYATAPAIGSTTTRAMADGRIIAARFDLATSATADLIAAGVASAATGGTGRVGIYEDNGSDKPGDLVVDAGTIDLTSATNQTISISQALTPGSWWLALLVENLGGSGTLRATAGGAWVLASNAATALTTDSNGWYSDGVTAGALPDPYPSPLVISNAYRLALRFA